jgi:hypothetical protein
MNLSTLRTNILKVRTSISKIEARLTILKRHRAYIASHTEEFMGPFGNYWTQSLELNETVLNKHTAYYKDVLKLEQSAKEVIELIHTSEEDTGVAGLTRTINKDLSTFFSEVGDELRELDTAIVHIKSIEKLLFEMGNAENNEE